MVLELLGPNLEVGNLNICRRYVLLDITLLHVLVQFRSGKLQQMLLICVSWHHVMLVLLHRCTMYEYGCETYVAKPKPIIIVFRTFSTCVEENSAQRQFCSLESSLS